MIKQEKTSRKNEWERTSEKMRQTHTHTNTRTYTNQHTAPNERERKQSLLTKIYSNAEESSERENLVLFYFGQNYSNCDMKALKSSFIPDFLSFFSLSFARSLSLVWSIFVFRCMWFFSLVSFQHFAFPLSLFVLVYDEEFSVPNHFLFSEGGQYSTYFKFGLMFTQQNQPQQQ